MKMQFVLICSAAFRNADGRKHQIGFWCHATWSSEPRRLARIRRSGLIPRDPILENRNYLTLTLLGIHAAPLYPPVTTKHLTLTLSLTLTLTLTPPHTH